jgi:sugar transferase EpsL
MLNKSHQSKALSGYQESLAKRSLDLAVSGLGMILGAPLFGLISLLIYFSMGRPIFFRQARPGLHSKPFAVTKFRTMTNCRDKAGRLLPDHERVTALGRFLRSHSLDELPEMFNVLKGEMSLVGPRPLLMQYLDRYTPDQKCRHDVKPGITGWAQINGRNDLTWEDKFALDLQYIEHQSLWLDIKILALTIKKVLRREGIDKPGHVGMEEFLGSRL